MATPAPHATLIRGPLRWPVSAQQLYGVLNLPEGFHKEIWHGRLRIGRPGRGIDDALIDLGDRLAGDVPGIRVEMYAGCIVVSGPPAMRHNDIVFALIAQLYDVMRDRGLAFYQTAGLINPAIRAYTVPDLVVAPRRAPRYDESLCGHGVRLAVEVTSPGGAQIDRSHKWLFYGQARVPLYLLVDQELSEVVLHSGPGDSGYRDALTVSLGKPLVLPEPFACTLDTGVLMS